MVRSRSLGFKKELGLTSEAGALKENIKKNRYKDILPYDQSRVELSLPTADSTSDYINASFIKGAAGDCKYIACQGPLSSTVTDFWRMIWQYNVKVKHTTQTIRIQKCECYWAAAHQSASFGPFTVSNVRTNSRSVIQYQFLSWPDHDVPYESAGVLDMLERTRSSHGANVSPLLIHCSAGCGRTGVICALDYIHDLLVTKKITSDFSILNIVLELRTQRPSTVQTKVGALSECETQMYLSFSLSACRLSQQVVMNDTYAVVNKPKHAHPPSSAPTYSASASAAPIYSTVKPRAKQQSLPPSMTPIYDIASPTGQKPGEGSDYQLVAGKERVVKEGRVSAQSSLDVNDYEDISSSVSDVTSFCSPGSIGFNCRIQKPRGPRDPPAEWTRVER
uniref:protein-tyrosine-phosphatase n=1 Tax=Oreochromis aureus TaxID=47969 RepID=A0A668UA75_OREAU